MAQGLRALKHDPASTEARNACLYGAWLCGTVLGNVGMALHHKLCHTLGGTFNLPHAETHTIVLPHAIAYNEDHAKAQTARISFALGVEGTARGAALALYDLAVELGAPTALESLGCVFAAFVLPEFEGNGLGRRLMDEAETFLFQHHQTIWLETAGASRASGFYRSLGWQPVENLPEGDIRFEKCQK